MQEQMVPKVLQLRFERLNFVSEHVLPAWQDISHRTTPTSLLSMKWLRPTALASLGSLAAIGASVFVATCSESPAPPLAPSSLPSEKVQALSLVCAASVLHPSSGGPVRVQYGSPMVQGGLDPITTDCTPVSGSAFPVGRSRVTCTGRDALQQTASCSLFVTVMIPTLGVTRLLAFGDSLTAGVTSTPVQAVSQLEPGASYPTKLAALLNQRYSGQSIRVANFGVPGERAVAAVSRFESALTIEQPDVVLLMEGTNDLIAGGTADSAATAIETMVRAARARGVDLILATIPPARANRKVTARVAPYNDRIRTIATGQGVPLVDVYQIINSGLCSDARAVTVPCIGDDDLHPTSQGYDLIANGMFRRIMAIYEFGGTGSLMVLTQTQMPGDEPPAILGRAWTAAGLR